jgi:hypothetical protein
VRRRSLTPGILEKAEETIKAGSNPVIPLMTIKDVDKSSCSPTIRFMVIITLARIHTMINAITAGLRLPCLGCDLRIADSPMPTSAGAKIPRLSKGDK